MEGETVEVHTNEVESKEYDMYTEEGIESFVDDDMINPFEQAFMKGYLDDNNSTDEVV